MASITIEVPDACEKALTDAEAEGALHADRTALEGIMHWAIESAAEEITRLAQGAAEGTLAGEDSASVPQRISKHAQEIEQLATALEAMGELTGV